MDFRETAAAAAARMSARATAGWPRMDAATPEASRRLHGLMEQNRTPNPARRWCMLLLLGPPLQQALLMEMGEGEACVDRWSPSLSACSARPQGARPTAVHLAKLRQAALAAGMPRRATDSTEACRLSTLLYRWISISFSGTPRWSTDRQITCSYLPHDQFWTHAWSSKYR
jgi:hypothetical protein